METKTDLEMKLEDLLKNVEGVGELEVMIVLKASSEKISLINASFIIILLIILKMFLYKLRTLIHENTKNVTKFEKM